MSAHFGRRSGVHGTACLIIAWTSPAQNCPRTSTGLIPVTDLGENLYKGFQGGQYPTGKNFRPPTHDAAGLAEAQKVVPRNAAAVGKSH